jgi:type II secretory pathway component PulC
MPLDEPDAAALAPAAPTAQPAPLVRKVPLIAYETISKRNLLQPLYDSAAPNQPPPKPSVKLVGTVIEPGFTYAMLKTKEGQVKGVSVGETVDGAEVTEVKADSVTVKFAGEMHTLKVEGQGAGS